jgi:hypothetical protein
VILIHSFKVQDLQLQLGRGLQADIAALTLPATVAYLANTPLLAVYPPRLFCNTRKWTSPLMLT